MAERSFTAWKTAGAGSNPLLPHEIFFGVFLAVTWIRLACAAGPAAPLSLMYLGCIIINLGVIMACFRRSAGPWWRLRLLFYPLVMTVTYFTMAPVVALIHPGMVDGFLLSVDSRIIGGNLSLKLEPLVSRPLTEAMSLFYILFHPSLIFMLGWYFTRDLAELKKFYAGYFIIYGIGYLGYTFLPATGPVTAMADRFHVPLAGWYADRYNDWLYRVGCNHVDVFPSLHCATSAYFLFFDFTHHRKRFWFYLVPCVGLWLATIYLRYHYFVDVLAGFALVGAAFWILARWERVISSSSHNRPAAGAGPGRPYITRPR
jgi:hypothetical protein